MQVGLFWKRQRTALVLLLLLETGRKLERGQERGGESGKMSGTTRATTWAPPVTPSPNPNPKHKEKQLRGSVRRLDVTKFPVATSPESAGTVAGHHRAGEGRSKDTGGTSHRDSETVGWKTGCRHT